MLFMMSFMVFLRRQGDLTSAFLSDRICKYINEIIFERKTEVSANGQK